jgi:sigma54-dependent transcription regulator
MSDDKKKVHISFAPGAFDSFDGTQEELDALVTEIERMAESGELQENSIALDEHDILDNMSEEDREQIMQALDNMTEGVRRKLQ